MRKAPQDLIGSWTRRRRFMYLVTGFCMATVTWVLYRGTDTVVAQTVVVAAFTTLISITGAYVFGATWDDRNKIQAGFAPGSEIKPKE